MHPAWTHPAILTGKRTAYMGRPAVEFGDSIHVPVGAIIHIGQAEGFNYFRDSATGYEWREA